MSSITIEDGYDIIKEHYLIILDSRNADIYANTTDNSDVIFSFKNPIINKTDDIISLTGSISNFTCPNSQYCINNTNNQIYVTRLEGPIGPNKQLIVIPVGNYNPTSFISTMKTLLNAAFIDNDFVFTISSITNCLTMSSIYYDFLIESAYINLSTKYLAGGVIGYLNNYTYASGGGFTTNLVIYSQISGKIPFIYPVNFSGINTINIHIPTFNTKNINSNTKSSGDVVANIPVNCSPNETIFFDKRSDFEFTITDPMVTSIRIKLKDSLGNLLQLNNQDWNLSFEVITLRKQRKQIKSFTEILKGNPF